MPARYVDPENARGNLPEGQFLLTSGVSDAIVETGLPIDRRYDPLEELARIRQIYAREANSVSRPRAAISFNTHRSLRRGV